MKAVVSCISYGLGNQLLQFAAGYGLAKHLGCPLDLDISWFDRDPGTTVANYFLLKYIIPQTSFRRILHYSSRQLLRDRALRAINFSIKRPYRHGVLIWNRPVKKIQPFNEISTPVALVGVPSYGDALTYARCEILDMFSKGLTEGSAVTAPSEGYAFLHVRLGDFVSSPHVKAKMVQLSREYYEAAMRRYEQKNGKTRWILLSNEPKKALDIIPADFSVDPPHQRSEIDDLFLMLRSQGGVIANSTFSLWGGLLAEHTGGDVIAPDVWRKDGRPRPVLPDTWIRI